jgi:hypothetical protein
MLLTRLRQGGGSSAYVTAGRDFDGTNDYATRGADLTGIADGQAGVFSGWVRFDGGDGAVQFIFANALGAGASTLHLNKTAGNVLQLQGRNAALTSILLNVSSTTYLAGAAWLHILASWNLAAGTGLLYVDDASVKNGAGTQLNDTIDYTLGNFAIGAGTGGASKLNGCLSEIFFHPTFLDISVEANRRLFRSAGGKPVSLGADGSLPLGVQPLIYMPAGDPSDNKGSGGNFVVTGTLDLASSSPSD